MGYFPYLIQKESQFLTRKFRVSLILVKVIVCKSLIAWALYKKCDLHETFKKSDLKQAWIKQCIVQRRRSNYFSETTYVLLHGLWQSVFKYDLINNLTVVADIEKNKCLSHL